MQLFITLFILALALAYALWRIVRTMRGHGDCGCGRGKDCPHCHAHGQADCRDRHRKHTLFLLLSLSTMTLSADVGGDAIVGLVEALRQLPATELHHLVIIQDGRVQADLHAWPFRAIDRHNQFSACKMLTSLAVGLAVDDGKLQLDDRVVDILPDKCPARQSAELQAITLRHLLTMTSGKQLNVTLRDTTADWSRHWMALDGTRPGTHFEYDTMTSFMLAALVQHATGHRVLDYLNDRILGPMGIDDVEWEMSPDSINTGGWGMRCSTMTMAMLGQLLLQGGRWQGRQLISADWVRQMSSDQLLSLGIAATHEDAYHDGYGYQMWRCALEGAYRAQGNMGQLTLIYPAGNLVVAANCVTTDQMGVLRVVQQHVPRLLSSGHEATLSSMQLEALKHSVQVPLLQGQPWSSSSDSLHFDLEENWHNIRSLDLRHDGAKVWLEISYEDGRREHAALGYSHWIYGQSRTTPPYNILAQNRFSGLASGFAVAGNYACQPAGKIVAQLRYVDWYNGITLVIDTSSSEVTIIDCTLPGRPEAVSLSGYSAPFRWWMVVFGALAATLVALIACNKND